MNIGKRIKMLRVAKEMSLQVLADITGMTVTKIGRMERGEVSHRIGDLEQLAGPLGVEVSDLVAKDFNVEA